MEGAYGIIKVEGFVTSVLKQPVPIENSVDLLILITRGSPAMNNIFTDRSRLNYHLNDIQRESYKAPLHMAMKKTANCGTQNKRKNIKKEIHITIHYEIVSNAILICFVS